MEATIKIDGKDVRFRATAAVPLLYRRKFNRDLFRDLRTVSEAMTGKDPDKSDLPIQALTTFEQMAYIMAKHADPDNVPDSLEKWLDGFSMLPVYAIFPVILDLWSGNVEGLEESKKKAELLIESLQQRYSSSGLLSSESPSGTWAC